MASFGLFSADDVGSLAGAAAGLVNATAPAVAAAAARGDVQRAARVSAKVVNYVQGAGNVASLAAFLVPIFTFVKPVLKAKGVEERTIHGFFIVFGSASLWFLFGLPPLHRDIFTLVVNGVAITAQLMYIGVYLFYAKEEKLDCAWRLVAIAAAITFGVLALMLPLVFATHVWSLKVIGISASAFSTANFLAGILDFVSLLKKQRTLFTFRQLGANLLAACIWTSYGFLFDPPNLYVVIPNIAGVAVNFLQICSHTMIRVKERNTRRRNQRDAAAAAAAAAANANQA